MLLVPSLKISTNYNENTVLTVFAGKGKADNQGEIVKVLTKNFCFNITGSWPEVSLAFLDDTPAAILDSDQFN